MATCICAFMYICLHGYSGHMEAIHLLTAPWPYGCGHVKDIHDQYAFGCMEDMYGYMGS
jgi:hypothetical protein